MYQIVKRNDIHDRKAADAAQQLENEIDSLLQLIEGQILRACAGFTDLRRALQHFNWAYSAEAWAGAVKAVEGAGYTCLYERGGYKIAALSW